MAYQISHQGRHPNALTTEFRCGSRADIDTLPVHPEVAYGSYAFVISDSSVHMLSPDDNKYHEI